MDPVEGRGRRKTEPLEGKMTETQSSTSISTRLERIAKLARDRRGEPLTTLAHHIDLEWLEEAYRRTRKNGATGIDGQTAKEYAANLESNLRSLLDRAKSGSYVAPAVRRVHIPKGDETETRPIGIPTFEDKVLQRAVAMVLEAVYEQEFFDCSYGFRPGRSAHQALTFVRDQTMKMGGRWVLEVDIRKFFDTLDHRHLREIVNQRIRDGVLLRLISKWLHAGVQTEGRIEYPDAGTPQGGVISPLLANIYLHEVLDKWFAGDVVPRLDGRAMLVRYADDFVIIFERRSDARRVMDVLPKRFAKYGLTLHPDKTRLVDFRRPRDGGPKSGIFNLLGFRHYWALSRNGKWLVKRATASDRFRRALRRIAEWCKRNRNQPLIAQWRMLKRKVLGHFLYFGLPGNTRALNRFSICVQWLWRKYLGRRSQRSRIPWARMHLLLKRYPLPVAKIYTIA
jgi:RNA-directed DNA polymerase